MYILIVGGGKIGSFLARTLSKEGEEIALIESDKEICQSLAEKLDILIINGDGTDAKDIEDAGAKKADVFVAATGEDKVNLVSCQMAKKNFNIPLTIARVNEPKNESVFESLGIDVAISSVTAVSMIIKNAVTSGELTTLLTLKEGNVELVELHVPENSPAINRTIKDLGLPDDCIFTAIIRHGHLIFPKGRTSMEAHDLVVALTTAGHVDELKKIVLGKNK